jgi:molybdate transport system ATP-binding protein
MPEPGNGSLHVRARITREGHGEQFSLDVEFEAEPGITILFGPSGSGKSTALQIAAGLLRPDEGRVTLGDEVWFDSAGGIDLAVHKRNVAYVFQSLALFPHLTALGNVCYGIDREVPREERVVRAHAMLERLGVDHLARRRLRTFSGGEAQRVALARALAMSPRVLLLDEPFSALDRDLRIQLATEVRELVDELGLPAIQVTHNHGEARALGDRVIKMRKGRITEIGAVADVLGLPGDPRTSEPRGKTRRPYDEIGETPMPELLRRK